MQAAETAAKEVTATAEATVSFAQSEQDAAQSVYDAQMKVVVDKIALRDERQGVYNQLKEVLSAHHDKKSRAEEAAIQAALTAYNKASIPATNV